MFDIRQMARFGAAGMLEALLIGAVAAPVDAQQRPVTVTAQPDQFTRVVQYGDLSLTTKEGRHLLLRRVDLAVDQVCPQLDEYGSFYDVADCKHFAWAAAQPQIEHVFDSALAGRPVAMSVLVITGGVRD